MKLLARFVVAIVVNAVGLLAAQYWLPNFHLTSGFKEVAVVTLIFTALNFVLKPILKIILTPFIVITFGLGLLVINALILLFLDKLSQNVTIEGTLTLVYATLIMTAANFVFHLATKK